MYGYHIKSHWKRIAGLIFIIITLGILYNYFELAQDGYVLSSIPSLLVQAGVTMFLAMAPNL